jgi:outer membrane phospholipase A
VPFRDTTYRPAILWMFPTKKIEGHPGLSWSADLGIFEHESNGRGPDPDQPFSSANNDSLSRSMNRSYLRPTLTYTDPELGIFSVTPKIFVPYLVSKGNKDMAEYRGYFDLLLKWTSQADRGHVVSLLWREGTHHGRHFVEAGYGLPLRVFSKDASGWILFQWLYGYGETLRDYRVRNPGTLRAGLMIVP